jgi:hypothetical protein
MRQNAVRLSVFYRLQIYIQVKINENKSREIDALIPVAKLLWRLGFGRWRYILVGSQNGTCFTLCHPSGAQNFEVALGFLENLCTFK